MFDEEGILKYYSKIDHLSVLHLIIYHIFKNIKLFNIRLWVPKEKSICVMRLERMLSKYCVTR